MESQILGSRVACFVFAFFSAAQFARWVSGLEVLVAGYLISVWMSGVAFLVLGGLSIWMVGLAWMPQK